MEEMHSRGVLLGDVRAVLCPPPWPSHMLLYMNCMLSAVADKWVETGTHRFGEMVMEVDINDKVVLSALSLIIEANILHMQRESSGR